MYAFIKGYLRESSPSYVVLEAAGVGYRIAISASAYDALPPIGEELMLYTSFVVREQLQALYGFPTAAERELFETVTTVSGVGPKLGMALLGHLSLGDLETAISNGDSRTLARVPGIGKRTAERLIVELSDRLPTLFPRDAAGEEKSGVGETTRVLQDATLALINLGYTQAMARKALAECRSELDQGLALPELITAALRRL